MKKNQIRRGKKRTFWTEIVFWLHLPIVIIWFGTFFIPLSLWPKRIIFHFWYILIFLLLQLLWGIILYPKTKKGDFICPLTTLLQYLRGYPIESKKNYNHSFIAELLERFHIKISFQWVNIMLWITLTIVTIQYLWFR
jgi:hypothetical protein